MIPILTERILSFIKANINVTSDEEVIYKYGIEITISSLLNIVIVIALSVVFDDILSGLCFLFCFIFLRQFSGGYHAESYFRCNLALAISYLCVICISHHITSMQIGILEGLLIIGLIIVVIFSPVNNRHKSLTEHEKSLFKKISVIIYSVFSLASIILKSLNSYYGTVIALTLLVVSLMIIIEIFMQKEGYHES